MKLFFSISLILISTFGFGQEYNFRPNWKQGDVKQIAITQVEKEYEVDVLIFDTIIYNEATVEILSVNEDDYTVEILLENQALSIAMEFYDKLGEKLQDYSDLKLIYSINKETAVAELLNWKEAQKFMANCFEEIYTLIDKNIPDKAPFVMMMFASIKDSYENKENIEAYMEANIGYILTPFNESFVLRETQTTTSTSKNPFRPLQEVSSTTLLKLESVDTESKTCTINQEIELDLTQFIEMMKTMMIEMAKSLGADDNEMAEHYKEMESIDIDAKNTQVITFDMETTWVTNVAKTGVVSSVNPRNGLKTMKELTITIEIK